MDLPFFPQLAHDPTNGTRRGYLNHRDLRVRADREEDTLE
jgi:hypothetical protein